MVGSILSLLPTCSHDNVGNGTQSIVWQINEESYRQTLESEGGDPSSKPGLRVYYGSMHDILSFPCEVRYPFTISSDQSHSLT